MTSAQPSLTGAIRGGEIEKEQEEEQEADRRMSAPWHTSFESRVHIIPVFIADSRDGPQRRPTDGTGSTPESRQWPQPEDEDEDERPRCPCANEVRALDLKIIISAEEEGEGGSESEGERSSCVASRGCAHPPQQQQDPDWPTSSARTAGPPGSDSAYSS